MRCRVCQEEDLVPLWEAGGRWSRCLVCGSDSSDNRYEDLAADYNADYQRHVVAGCGGFAEAVGELNSNVEWFRDHRGKCAGRDFLDVGHNDGASLTAMQADGWSVHGFDVNPAADLGPHTTIAPRFSALLFPRRYDSVLCREVIEHVPGWRAMLLECQRATADTGLFQIQTPRPMAEPELTRYQRFHLQLFSPLALRFELERVGFQVLDGRLWPGGQAWLCRKI
jgi:2-polyprenyl-3-methyl-5-hydroxy-6-metoxy-1,4-benzoquinol methylase